MNIREVYVLGTLHKWLIKTTRRLSEKMKQFEMTVTVSGGRVPLSAISSGHNIIILEPVLEHW